MKNIIYPLFFLFTQINAQPNLIHKNLPIGKYAVGFKIITIKDDSRIAKPEYNYLGERNDGDRTKKITIHLWYPAKPDLTKRKITYGEYGYNHLLASTNETISEEQRLAQLRNRQKTAERWFGIPTEEAWKKLIQTKMLGHADAAPVKEDFPLLIGVLRPLSTAIANEMLASNGYVVAMITGINERSISFADDAINDIPSLQLVISYLKKAWNIDESKIGTFGFSGSGFTQVLFSMFDSRIKALADLESGIYMDGLYQQFSKSNFYKPEQLRIPFLHIFSRSLSKEEKYLSDFEQKTKFSNRYRLLLNEPKLHHWDFAEEGYTSCIVLQNRGAQQLNIQRSFEVTSRYLLNFFNAELKSDAQAKSFLTTKPTPAEISPLLWDIAVLPALKTGYES